MDEMRAHLAELMGSIHKEDKGIGKEFTDSDVCKYYLTGLCPHELFENTKHYMGECHKIHSDELREKYMKARRKKRFRYEEEAIRIIQPLIDDSNKKIARGLQRCEEDEKKADVNDDIKKIDEIIQAKMKEVEQLGNAGNVEASMKAMEVLSKLNQEKTKLVDAKNQENSTAHRLKPCSICGALLSTTDSDRRLSEHVSGKIHIGFQRLRDALKELREYVSNVAPTLEEYHYSRSSRERSSSTERWDMQRDSRDSERDRDRHRNSRGRSKKSIERGGKERKHRDKTRERHDGHHHHYHHERKNKKGKKHRNRSKSRSRSRSGSSY